MAKLNEVFVVREATPDSPAGKVAAKGGTAMPLSFVKLSPPEIIEVFEALMKSQRTPGIKKFLDQVKAEIMAQTR